MIKSFGMAKGAGVAVTLTALGVLEAGKLIVIGQVSVCEWRMPKCCQHGLFFGVVIGVPILLLTIVKVSD